MIQKLKHFIIVTVASSTLLVPALAAVTVSTVTADNITSNLCTGSNSATGGTGDCTAGGATSSIEGIASTVVTVFSIIVGIVAVIMVIYGGFRYITSGGSSERITGAKNSLIYAIVGLLIVALAQLIVHYVLSQATTVNSSNNL
jgi:hypothetical protein